MDWQLSTVNAPIGTLFRAMLKKPKDDIPAGELAAAATLGGKVWTMLDTQLSKTAFVAGDQLTVGDIALGNAIHRWYKFPIEHPPLTHLKRIWTRGFAPGLLTKNISRSL